MTVAGILVFGTAKLRKMRATVIDRRYRISMRLSRLERVFQRNPIYFVTTCTCERGSLLDNPTVHGALIRFAQNGPEHGAWLGRYVLMPDHLHAFVALDETRLNLSNWMKSLKNALSKVFREMGRPAPHWQKGFFDHVLRSSESYAQKWNYVRENPIRAGLVTHLDHWPYQGAPFALEYTHDILL